MNPPQITRRSRSKYVAVFAVVAVIVLVLDQGTKAWAKQALSGGNIIEVIPHLLSFVLVRNPGASLGFASGHTWVISILAFVACVLLAYASAQTDSHEWAVLLGTAFGGAAGNLIDRIVYAEHVLDGRVVDFIDYGWSVGNVADIFLTIAGIGVCALVLRGVAFRSGLDGRKPIPAEAYLSATSDEPAEMPAEPSEERPGCVIASTSGSDTDAGKADRPEEDSEVNGRGSGAK